jgi:hypothetical protein
MNSVTPYSLVHAKRRLPVPLKQVARCLGTAGELWAEWAPTVPSGPLWGLGAAVGSRVEWAVGLEFASQTCCVMRQSRGRAPPSLWRAPPAASSPPSRGRAEKLLHTGAARDKAAVPCFAEVLGSGCLDCSSKETRFLQEAACFEIKPVLCLRN